MTRPAKKRTWHRPHVITVASIGVMIGIAGGAWPIITWLIDRHDSQVRLQQTVDWNTRSIEYIFKKIGGDDRNKD